MGINRSLEPSIAYLLTGLGFAIGTRIVRRGWLPSRSLTYAAMLEVGLYSCPADNPDCADHSSEGVELNPFLV